MSTGSDYEAAEIVAERAGVEGSTSAAELFEDHRGEGGGGLQGWLAGKVTLGSLGVLILAVIFFSFWATNSRGEHVFLRGNTFSLIIQQTMVVGILAVAQSLVVLTAGIDLSVGSIMVFCMMTMAVVARDYATPPLLILLLGLLLGLACGFINGFLITRLKLPPFIVTLGTLSIYFALNLFVSSSQSVNGSDTNSLLLWTGRTFKIVGTKFTYGSVLMLVIFAIFAFILRNSSWGRHIYATGDDVDAARLAGIRTDRVLISVYTVGGLLCAIAAWCLIGRIGAASPESGQQENLQSITAVVVGGISLFGGRGRLIGALFGTLIVGVFEIGLKLGGVQVLWQRFAVGVLVVAAVAIDQWIRRAQQ